MMPSKSTLIFILSSIFVISLFEIAEAAKKAGKASKQDKISEAITNEKSNDVNKKAKAAMKIVMEMKMPTLANDKKPKEGRLRDAIVDALKKHLPAFNFKDEAAFFKLLNEVAHSDEALQKYKLHWEAKTKKGKIETELEKVVKKNGSIDEQAKVVIKITMEEKAGQILKELKKNKKKNAQVEKRLADSVAGAIKEYLHKPLEAKHLAQLMTTVGEHDAKLKELKVQWKQMEHLLEGKTKPNEKKNGQAKKGKEAAAGGHEKKGKSKPAVEHGAQPAAGANHDGKDKKVEEAKHDGHPKGKAATKKGDEKKKKSEEKHETATEQGNVGMGVDNLVGDEEERMQPSSSIEGGSEDDEMPRMGANDDEQNEGFGNEEENHLMAEDRLEEGSENEGAIGGAIEEAGEREDSQIGGNEQDAEMDGDNVERDGAELEEEEEQMMGAAKDEDDDENGKIGEQNAMGA